MTTTLPFQNIKLTFQDGEVISIPLTDANAMHAKKGTLSLAKKFSKVFQEKVLDKGKYEQLMTQFRKGEFAKRVIKVDFPKAKDNVSYPAFSLEFDVYVQEEKNGIWGIIPALGLECMAKDEATFSQRAAEVIQVEFTARKRLQAVQSIISAMWFEKTSLKSTEVELKFHTPAELKEIHQDKGQKLLSKVATKLKVKKAEAYGREEHVKQMGRILSGRFSKNILLVGASGTGKTALVREVAFRRSKAKEEADIWETSASRLIKELTGDTGWQDNLSILVSELTEQGDFLFVRNLSDLFEVGRYEGNDVSMAEYLRSSLGRGEFTLIAECTSEERARIELLSPNYLAFFQVVELQAPQKGLEDIIVKKVGDLAGDNQVEFQPGAVEEVIRLHQRFMPYSGMPGKPIRFLESVLLAKKEVVKEKAKDQKAKANARKAPITREAVLEYFSQDSGMPLFLIDPDKPMDVHDIKQNFNENVFGQEKAVEAVTGLLASVKTALTRSGKPIASFLFVGPTGVGKTELAKVLANFTFGSRERMVRFDMSEYSNPYAVMRLTGQHFNSDGLLTSAVRREPFCVLLFDEIEKADPSFFDLLLQILGEGRLSDSRGQLVNFCSAIIVMTSNIGAANLSQNRIGWKKELDTDDVTAHFTREVEKHFKPELFNRIDSVVAFEPLSKETVRYVVEREIQLFKKREGIQFRRVDLDITDEALDLLAEKGYDPKYGARYLQRAIREVLIIPLAHELNRHEHDDRLSIKVLVEENEIEIKVEADEMAFDLLMEQWDKLTLAEESSRLRRKMVRMLEGPVFMRMQSELDMMETEKERMKEKFWEDRNASGQYTHFLSAKERSEKLIQEIQDFEMEMALSSMGQAEFQADFQERLDAWNQRLQTWQLQVHSLFYPNENVFRFGFYGKSPEKPMAFYLQLFLKKEIEISHAHAIWFKEGSSGKGQFEKQIINFETLKSGKFKPSASGLTLYGFELKLEAPAVKKYLGWEIGIQKWEGQEKGQWNNYHMLMHGEEFETPDNIHRQNFYKNPKAHRTWADRELLDNRLNIQSSARPPERSEIITKKLDELFWAVMDKVFLGAG